MNTQKLEATRRFWNEFPGDGQADLETRRRLRYNRETWMLARLRRIAERHGSIVEIGCGQGTDALALCSYMAPGGQYLGLDYSEESIASAIAAARQAGSELKVRPEFRKGNAEALDLESGSVESVYSMGVLHHTPETEKSISEIYRVLKPGGRAYISLYRSWAPKVFIALGLRLIQRASDAVTGREQSLLPLVRRYSLEKYMGSALPECFGVPIMRSYTEAQMRRLFSRFKIKELAVCGRNLPYHLVPWARVGGDEGPFGVYYFIDAEKPVQEGDMA